MTGFWVEAKPLMNKIRWSRMDMESYIKSAEYRRSLQDPRQEERAKEYDHRGFQCRQHKIRYQKKLARLMRRHGIPGPDPESLNLRPKKCKKVGTRYPGKKRTSETACMHPLTDTT